MSHIVLMLHQLDDVYHTGGLETYEQCWQRIASHVAHLYPGFTLAYAEIATAGEDRYSHGGMRHVLVPQQEQGTATPTC